MSSVDQRHGRCQRYRGILIGSLPIEGGQKFALFGRPPENVPLFDLLYHRREPPGGAVGAFGLGHFVRSELPSFGPSTVGVALGAEAGPSVAVSQPCARTTVGTS
jgi:hypothetical protein